MMLIAYSDANKLKQILSVSCRATCLDMLEMAAESILQEQGSESEAESYNGQAVTIGPSLAAL
jgi:hypothetical protein